MYVLGRRNLIGFSIAVRYTDTSKLFLTQIESRLKGASSVVLEIDSWSDMSTMTKYLGVIAHAVDGKEAALGSGYMLHFSHSEVSETSQYLMETVDKALQKASIDPKAITCIVTDSGANMKGMAKKNGLPRVACLAHVIDNVCKSTMKNIKFMTEIQDCARRTIAHFNQSVTDCKLLVQIQKELGLLLKGLPSFSETRWNSFLQALDSLRANSEALSIWMDRTENSSNRHIKGLTEIQTKIMDLIDPHLRFLFNLTEDMISQRADFDAQIGKRATFLKKGIQFINTLVLDGFLFIFDSWIDLQKDRSERIDLDATTLENDATQSANIFAAIFVLELAVRMRHYWLNRVLVDLNSDQNHISIDAILIKTICSLKWVDIDQEVESMLTSKRASQAEHVEEFLQAVRATTDRSTISGENTIESDDVVNSFVRNWKNIDLDVLLTCFKMIRKGAIDDVETISSLANEHVERASAWYFSPAQKPSAVQETSPIVISPTDIDLTNNESNDVIVENSEDEHISAKNAKKSKRAPKRKRKAASGSSSKSKPLYKPKIVELDIVKFANVLLRVKIAPCSSVNAERSFSVATRRVLPQRSSLLPSNFEKEVQIIANYRLMPRQELYEALRWNQTVIKCTAPATDPQSDDDYCEYYPKGDETLEIDYWDSEDPPEPRSPTPGISPSNSGVSAASVASYPVEDDEEDDRIVRFAVTTPKNTRNTPQSKKRKGETRTSNSLPITYQAGPPPKKRSTAPDNPVNSADREDNAIANLQKRASKKKQTVSVLSRSRESFIDEILLYLSNEILGSHFLTKIICKEGAKDRTSFETTFALAAKEGLLRPLLNQYLEAQLEPLIKTDFHWFDSMLSILLEEANAEKFKVLRRNTANNTKRVTAHLPGVSPETTFPRSREEIDPYLNLIGRQSKDVDSNGNCFFDAMVHSLHHPFSVVKPNEYYVPEKLPKTFQACRAQVVNHMLGNVKRWTSSLVKPKNNATGMEPLEWVQKFAHNGVWAESQVVFAAADLYQVQIDCVCLGEKIKTALPRDGLPPLAHVLLVNITNLHFMATEPANHTCTNCLENP